MYKAVVLLCLALIIAAYFRNNPLQHSRSFVMRRFLNWFPLGMTYSFLYMGRYNLIVAKNALGTLMPNEAFGLIFGIGTLVYALSFLVNGPLVDKIGGKKGIMIGAFGTVAANLALGGLTWLVTTGRLKINLILAYSALYALNMYFQSYGAVSIIKVKAYWFHVRERGVFGAIFGTLISFGVYFAFDWGGAIVNWASNVSAVFFIPAAIVAFWGIVDIWAVKDTPEDAGYPAFDTHDASSGQMHVKFSTWQLLKKVFASPVMMMIATVEFSSGVFRNGITQWFYVFGHDATQPEIKWFEDHWGWLVCIVGIGGGFAAGIVSDKVFQSRRGPPAAFLCGIVLIGSGAMAASLHSIPLMVGISALAIVASSVGITSLMSGTAATDMGGRTATATCAGLVDGFAYLGSAVQSFGISALIEGGNWQWWPLFLVPFAVLGLAIAIRIWFELPPATKRYIETVEIKDAVPAPA